MRVSVRRVVALVALALAAPLCASAVEERVAFLAYSEGFWQAWVMRPDGTEIRQVTRSPIEKARVAWYPDGTHLLIVDLDGHLIRVDIASGEEESVDVGLSAVHDVDVSPDGTLIAVSANPGDVMDAHDIWLVGVRGEERRRLARMPDLQHGPRWSRNGEWVYFLSGDGEQDHDIWRVELDTGSREQLTVGQRYHFEIDLSPDDSLAFSSNRTGDYEIYVLDSEGEAARWTNSKGLDGHPTWSPNGRALIYHSTRGGAINLWRQDGREESARSLTSFPEGARAPEWWGRP